MKIAVLGTGMVGTTIATKLITLGHYVCLGSRSADNETAAKWAAENKADHGTFAQAAVFGELIFNCTEGVHSLEALEQASAANLSGKVLIDVANELEFGPTGPKSLASAENSLGAKIQAAYPDAKVVKTLNTINCNIMVNPGLVKEPSSVFMSGDDAEAKQTVRQLLRSFGWADAEIYDLGGIENAKATEMYMPLWISLWGALGGADDTNFNIRVTR